MMRVYVYEKQNFFIEKNVARPLYRELVMQVALAPDELSADELRHIPIEHATHIKSDTDGIHIRYQILGQIGTIYHAHQHNDGC